MASTSTAYEYSCLDIIKTENSQTGTPAICTLTHNSRDPEFSLHSITTLVTLTSLQFIANTIT